MTVKITKWCIHYNGFQNDRCAAGRVYLEQARPLTAEEISWHDKNYPEMPAEKTVIYERAPCCPTDEPDENGATCPDFRRPTGAEGDE